METFHFLILRTLFSLCFHKSENYGTNFLTQGRTEKIRASTSDPGSYIVSVNPASWTNARADCIARLKNRNGTAGLLAPETKEEQNVVLRLLEQQGYDYGRFWTSGFYSGLKKQWMWARNENNVPSWEVPKKGYNWQQPTNLNRILLVIETRIETRLVTVPGGQFRPLCQTQLGNVNLNSTTYIEGLEFLGQANGTNGGTVYYVGTSEIPLEKASETCRKKGLDLAQASESLRIETLEEFFKRVGKVGRFWVDLGGSETIKNGTGGHTLLVEQKKEITFESDMDSTPNRYICELSNVPQMV